VDILLVLLLKRSSFVNHQLYEKGFSSYNSAIITAFVNELLGLQLSSSVLCTIENKVF